MCNFENKREKSTSHKNLVRKCYSFTQVSHKLCIQHIWSFSFRCPTHQQSWYNQQLCPGVQCKFISACSSMCGYAYYMWPAYICVSTGRQEASLGCYSSIIPFQFFWDSVSHWPVRLVTEHGGSPCLYPATYTALELQIWVTIPGIFIVFICVLGIKIRSLTWFYISPHIAYFHLLHLKH